MKKIIILLFIVGKTNVYSQDKLSFFHFSIPENRSSVYIPINDSLFNKEAIKDSGFKSITVYASIIGNNKSEKTERWIHCRYVFDDFGKTIYIVSEGLRDTTFFPDYQYYNDHELCCNNKSNVVLDNDSIFSWFDLDKNQDTISFNSFLFDNMGNIIAMDKYPYPNYKISCYVGSEFHYKFRFDNNMLIGFDNGKGFEFTYTYLQNACITNRFEIKTSTKTRVRALSRKTFKNKEIITCKSIIPEENQKVIIYFDNLDRRILRKGIFQVENAETISYEFHYER